MAVTTTGGTLIPGQGIPMIGGDVSAPGGPPGAESWSGSRSHGQGESFGESFIPEYSQTPILEEISRYARSMAPQVYQWGIDQFNRNQGNIDALMRDALSYASPQRIAVDMGMAEAGVQQAAEAGRQSAIRDLESYGVDPSSGRYAALDSANRVMAAASAAGAGNQQRMADIAAGNAMRNQALSAGIQNTQIGYEAAKAMNALLGTAMQLKYPPLGQRSYSYNVTDSESRSAKMPTGQGGGGKGGGGKGDGGGGDGKPPGGGGGGGRQPPKPKEEKPKPPGPKRGEPPKPIKDADVQDEREAMPAELDPAEQRRIYAEESRRLAEEQIKDARDAENQREAEEANQAELDAARAAENQREAAEADQAELDAAGIGQVDLDAARAAENQREAEAANLAEMERPLSPPPTEYDVSSWDQEPPQETGFVPRPLSPPSTDVPEQYIDPEQNQLPDPLDREDDVDTSNFVPYQTVGMGDWLAPPSYDQGQALEQWRAPTDPDNVWGAETAAMPQGAPTAEDMLRRPDDTDSDVGPIDYSTAWDQEPRQDEFGPVDDFQAGEPEVGSWDQEPAQEPFDPYADQTGWDQEPLQEPTGWDQEPQQDWEQEADRWAQDQQDQQDQWQDQWEQDQQDQEDWGGGDEEWDWGGEDEGEDWGGEEDFDEDWDSGEGDSDSGEYRHGGPVRMPRYARGGPMRRPMRPMRRPPPRRPMPTGYRPQPMLGAPPPGAPARSIVSAPGLPAATAGAMPRAGGEQLIPQRLPQMQRGGRVGYRPEATRGGFVSRELSPSNGSKVDDVNAQLNAGEFVIPKDVTAYKGKEFFYKLIAQARKLQATGGAKPQPKPNGQRTGYAIGGSVTTPMMGGSTAMQGVGGSPGLGGTQGLNGGMYE
jgi:hypothetical protein